MVRFAITLSLSVLLAASLHAGDSAVTVPLSVTVEKEPVNTLVPMYRAYVAAEENRFCFLIPENYHLGGDPAHGKIELSNLEGDGCMTFTFLGPVTDAGGAGREAYRELLAKRYANAKIVAEFSQSAAGRSGLGFDVEWQGAAGLKQKTRAVYVATVAGMLELTVTTGIKNFPTAQASFNTVLGTLAGGVNGKLVVNHVSDRL